MDDSTVSFEQLLERARLGDNEAIGQLFRRYSDPVRRVVRRMLNEKLRPRYDSLDFVQSVWLSFISLPSSSYAFDTPDELVAFLSRVAYNKVVDTARSKFGARKNNVDLERSMDVSDSRGATLGESLAARTPTPSQFVMADERWQQIVEGLPAAHRRIMELLRDGHSQVDISQKLGIDIRFIQRLRNRLQYELDPP